ncbi:MAG TPA: hypothetical protein VF841_00260 [Anaeromyxobacter sp.]
MSCPLLRRAHPPQCRAVGGGPEPVGGGVVATYCRARFGDCPAYRYVRAAGRLLHPADFRSWVLDGIAPGRLAAPSEDAEARPDAG